MKLDDLKARLTGRARFCRDRGEIKSPELMEEAATAITDLEALVGELGEALGKIADLGSDGEHSGDRHARCRDIARATLAKLEKARGKDQEHG